MPYLPDFEKLSLFQREAEREKEKKAARYGEEEAKKWQVRTKIAKEEEKASLAKALEESEKKKAQLKARPLWQKAVDILPGEQFREPSQPKPKAPPMRFEAAPGPTIHEQWFAPKPSPKPKITLPEAARFTVPAHEPIIPRPVTPQPPKPQAPKPSQGILGGIKESWQLGDVQTTYALEKWKEMQGLPNKSAEAKKAYEQQRAEAPQVKLDWKNPGSVVKTALFGAAEMLPMVVRGLGESAKQGAQYAAAGAGAAALGGQLGPQVLTPEEVVTVPAAAGLGWTVGTVKGMLDFTSKVEAGLAYDDYLQQGIDPQVAAQAAQIAGLINGVMETGALGEVIKTVPGGRQLMNPLKKGVNKVVADTLAKKLAARGAQYGMAVTAETLTEVAQEASTIVGNQIAVAANNRLKDEDLPKLTAKEIQDRLKDTFVEAGLSMAVLPLPGTVAGAAIDIAGARRQARPGTVVPSIPLTPQPPAIIPTAPTVPPAQAAIPPAPPAQVAPPTVPVVVPEAVKPTAPPAPTTAVIAPEITKPTVQPVLETPGQPAITPPTPAATVTAPTSPAPPVPGQVAAERGEKPTPSRIRMIQRGKHGPVKIIFPTKFHADLFGFTSRMQKGERGEGGFSGPEEVMAWTNLLRKNLGLPDDANIGGVASKYRQAILEATKELPAKDTYNAPTVVEVFPELFKSMTAPEAKATTATQLTSGVAVKPEAAVSPIPEGAIPVELEKPWTTSPEMYQLRKGVPQPLIAEISPAQYAALSERQKKAYDKKRAEEWEASKAVKDEWRQKVLEALDRGEISIDTPELSTEAKRVIRSESTRREKAGQEEAFRRAVGENQIKSIDELEIGDKVYSIKVGQYITVTKKFKKSVQGTYESGYGAGQPVNFKTGELWWKSTDDLEKAIKKGQSIKPVRGAEAAPTTAKTAPPKATEGSALAELKNYIQANNLDIIKNSDDRNRSEVVKLLQRLGQESTGVRLGDAEETGLLRYMLDRGEIKQDEWEKHIKSLVAENRIKDKSKLPSVFPGETKEIGGEIAPERPAVTEVSPAQKGKKAVAKTERGTSVDVQYAVVEANNLIASHTTDLRRNPKYPEELQPRQRERVASEDQIIRIISSLEPEFLGESPKASEGAPIVGPDMLVESGNARTIALKRAYQANHKNADKYRQWLVDNADKLGLDADAVKNMKNPILVRVRISEVDRTKFVQEANEQAVAAMSATEQAKADAKKLTKNLMAVFAPSDDGEINTATNRNFISRFMNEIVGPNERARYMTKEGLLSQEGVSRIRNAIFAKAYEDIAAIEKLAESTDNNVRNITNAMLVAAPRLAAIKEDIAQGALFDLDITPDIVAAMNKLSSLRESGTTVQEYLIQKQLFGEDLSPVAKDILNIFDRNKRSSKKILTILLSYADAVEAIGDPRQQTLFARDNVTKAEALQMALRRAGEIGDIRQAALFKGETLGGGEAGAGTGEKGPTEVRKGEREKATVASMAELDNLRNKADVPLADRVKGVPKGKDFYAAPRFAPQKTSIKQVARGLRIGVELGIFKKGMTVVDVGGGIYDQGTNYLAEHGITNLVYDPYARPERHNNDVFQRIKDIGGADAVALNNVLNVIPEAESRADILKFAYGLLKNGGQMVITVYAGNGSGNGAIREFKDGTYTWQENRPVDSYSDEIRRALKGAQIEKRQGAFIIAKPATGVKPVKAVERMAGAAAAPVIPPSGRVNDVVARTAILSFIRKEFKVPVHKGRYPFAQENALGVYKRFEQVIRTKKAEDLTAIAHEFGHHLDNLNRWSDRKRSYDDELFALAEALYGPELVQGKPANYLRREGIAEFTRAWLINPDYARGEAPEFYAVFEKAIDNDQEIGPAIRQLQNMFIRYYAQNPEEMLRAAISWKEEREPFTLERVREAGRETIRNVYAGLVDELDPLKISTETFERAWRARGYRGVVQALIEGDKQGRVVIEGKYLGLSLTTILKPVTTSAEQTEQFSEYAVAKRIVYLADKRGWSDDKFIIPVETARHVVAKFETPTFQKALDEVRNWSNLLLRYYADSGMLSDDAVKAMIEANEVYVPFTRVAGIGEKGMTDARAGTGKKMANLGQAGSAKRMKGGMGTIVNPLESLVRNAFTMVHLAERNRVAALLAKWADETPGVGFIMEKIPPDVQATLMTSDELARALKAVGVEEDDIKAARADLKVFLRLQELSKKVAKGTLTLKEESELEGLQEYQNQSDLDLSAKVWLYRAYMYPTVQASREGIVMVWRDGEPTFYQVKDPLLYRSLLMLDNITATIVQKLLSPIARNLRDFATITFEFIGRNVTRDALDAAVFGRGIPFEAMMRGVADIFGSQKWLNEWRASGAANTTLNALDRNYLQREVNKILAYRTGTLRKQLLSPKAAMRELSEIFEEATRVGEFQMAMTGSNLMTQLLRLQPRPATRTQAAIEARDVTIDFMRSGPWGRFWNSITAFFNSGIQGFDKFRRVFLSKETTAEEKARRLARAVMFVTLPTVLLYLVNRDDDDYQRLPQWRKDMFWNIPFGNGHFVPIPIPHILGFVFKVVPERFMVYLETKDKDAFKELSATAGATMVPSILPTAVALVTELASNYSMFLGRPIVPESEKRLEPALQYGPYTSETAKLVGKGIGVSPRQVEYAARGVFGGAAMYFTDVTDWLLGTTGLIETPPPSQKEIPILSRVERTFYIEPTSSSTAAVEDFYDTLDRMEMLWASVPKRAGVHKTLGTIGDWSKEEVARYRAEKAKLPPEDQELLTQGSKLRSVRNELSDLRKQVKAIQDNPKMPTEQKEALIKKLQMEMDKKASNALARLKKAAGE